MKITFFSTFLNHHQIEFCNRMYDVHGDDFTFVATRDMEEQRKQLKFPEYDRPYKLKMHNNEETRKRAEELFFESDVVILGVNMPEQLRKRLKAGKLTFLYKERLFKEKPSLYKYARSLAYSIREYWPNKNKPFYMLAASAYTHKDFKSLGVFADKTFAWGYFPPLKLYEENELIENKNGEEINLLWAGRFIEWKNPFYLINVAQTLKAKGIPFHIDVVGTGLLEDEMKLRIKKYGLEKEIYLHGALPQEEVRAYMEKANIYLFTSNRQEGFGAVLFEAMNSGCAVVASETAGATELLINDGINGRIYKDDSVDELCEIVLDLLREPNKLSELGLNAYRTIKEEQNAQVAADRLSCVCEAMIHKTEIPQYESGPMRKIR